MAAVTLLPSPADVRVERIVTLLVLAAPALLLCLPYTGGEVTSHNITPADVACAVLVGFCAVQVLRGRTRPLSRRAVVVFAAPVVALAAATVTAGDPATALPGLVRYAEVFVLVPVAVLLLVRTAADFRAVACCLVALALFEGALGVWQYATGTGASYMGQNIRAVGTFGATDVMGMATVVALGMVAAVAMGVRPVAGRGRWWRPGLLIAAGLLTVPLGLSFSRGAWIATAITLAAVLVFAGWRPLVQVLATVTAAAVVVVGGFGVGSDMLDQRLNSITQVTETPDQSVLDRYTMWAAAADMWRERPATGVGLKGFPAHRDAHASLALSSGSDTGGAGRAFHRQPLLSPHNMYLLVLSEQGLIGIVGLVGCWLALLALALARTARAVRRGAAGAECGLVAVGLLVWQLVDFLYADIGGPSTALTGLVFGLGACWALGPAFRAGPEEAGARD
ncbi:O-antigen ligase family protein [Streptomyces sp. KLOTTS4A1]|uniref:O-antigen ligase family protein n=1 Tax=Streptomyces sp. KLOTTS4A1 TaxID=3390996 RepID=UPI0039F51EB1